MSDHPAHLRYSASHEYVLLQDGTATIGITAHATSELGDVVYVELPKVGKRIAAGTSFGTVESVKAVSDLYLPVSGTIAEINTQLESEPELVNLDPYGAGWMVKVTLEDAGEVEQLMSAEEYLAQL